MQELTKAQEQILRVLWEIEEGVVGNIIDHLPDPKPAYNTVSTVVKVLEKKNLVISRPISWLLLTNKKAKNELG